VVDRVTILNLFDRVNLIRPSEGIGIFQSAYGRASPSWTR